MIGVVEKRKYDIVDMANQYFNNERNRKAVTMELILNDVCAALDLQVKQVKARCRKRELVMARQMFFYISRRKTIETLKNIGQYIGDMDHTTVIRSSRVIEDLITTKNHQFILYWNQYICRSKLFTENDFA